MGVLSRQLYPSALSEGLVPAFQSFRDRFGAALAIAIELDEELVKQEQADRNFLPEQVGLAAYRIAEEALTNVVEHAKASKVTVRLDSSRDRLVTSHGAGRRPGLRCGKSPRAGWGWEQCKTTPRPWMESVRSTAIRAWCTEVTAVLPLSRPDAEHLESSEKGDN